MSLFDVSSVYGEKYERGGSMYALMTWWWKKRSHLSGIFSSQVEKFGSFFGVTRSHNRQIECWSQREKVQQWPISKFGDLYKLVWKFSVQQRGKNKSIKGIFPLKPQKRRNPLNNVRNKQYNVRIVLLETRAFQRYPICPGSTEKSGSCSGKLENTHTDHLNLTMAIASGNGLRGNVPQGAPLFWLWCIAINGPLTPQIISTCSGVVAYWAKMTAWGARLHVRH